MGNMNDLYLLTASEISKAYSNGSLSPVELVRSLLERISSLEPKLNAFIRIEAETAIKDALQAEREIHAGRMVGPLHGVPIGIKDIIDISGLPTTCHSKIRLSYIATSDAVVISRLRSAGVIFMGKLALHEFAIGGPAHDLPFPPARNPWNAEHQPGGSSSGCGTALASGMLPLALGTDTGGSIRNPAGHCGVVGLKPTYDLVSREGVFPLASTLDHVGPMARSVSDLAHFMNIITSAKSDQKMPSFDVDLMLGVRGLKIGIIRHFHEKDLLASPEVIAAIDSVTQVLEDEGAIVKDITLPRLQVFSAVHRVIFHSEAWAVHSQWLSDRPSDYSGISRRKLIPGALISAGQYLQAQEYRLKLQADVENTFRDIDVLLVANSFDPASKIDDEPECTRTYPRHARSPFNLTGHPALSVMAGLSDKGLPLSVQFIGRANDEATVLRVGAAYERATGGMLRQPPALVP